MYKMLDLAFVVLLTISSTMASPVVFSAVLTTTESVVGGNTVVYDSVLTNVDSAYDETTGIFTAPVTGVYEFRVHALSDNNNRAFLDIVADGSYVASVFAVSTGSNEFEAGSQSVIISLTAADEVKVIAKTGFDSRLLGDSSNDYLYNSFSGVLLLDQGGCSV